MPSSTSECCCCRLERLVTSSTAVIWPCGSNTGTAEQVSDVRRVKKWSSRRTATGLAATRQVPMPLVPASASLHTAPTWKPSGVTSSAKAGEDTMCRITPSVSVSTTADSVSASCW
ncbi:hypothetical protein X551_04402 [Methylibium sp. T29]|nr:hypothetical protein X551_04402 [Methylibium sp. T29]